MNTISLLLAQDPAPAATGLTTAGAIIMTLSVAMVLGLCTFCFWRILREPKPTGREMR